MLQLGGQRGGGNVGVRTPGGDLVVQLLQTLKDGQEEVVRYSTAKEHCGATTCVLCWEGGEGRGGEGRGGEGRGGEGRGGEGRGGEGRGGEGRGGEGRGGEGGGEGRGGEGRGGEGRGGEGEGTVHISTLNFVNYHYF